MATKKLKLTLPPETVKVGYIDYSLDKQDKAWKDKHEAFGETQTIEQVIRYAEDHPNQVELANTIIHELFHALTNFGSIKFPDDEQEEHVVAGFSNLLFMVLKDNPELLTWLYNSIKGEAD